MSADPPIDPALPPAPARPSLRASSWGGAKLGTRAAWFVAWPLFLLVATAYLVPTAIGLGAGYGIAWHPGIRSSIGILFGLEWCGFLLGGMAGLAIGLIRRASGWSGPGRWSRLLDRPIRLLPRRRPPGPPASPRPRRRWRRWEVYAAASAVLVLAVATGAGAYLGGITRHRLAAAIAAADRDDPNWRLDDLLAAREAVPDGENAALVAGEVEAMLPGGWPPRPPAGADLLATPLGAALARTPPPDAADRVDDDVAAVVRAALDERGDAVEMARTLAGYRRGRHELDVPLNPIATLLPETQAARDVARLLASDAEVLAHDGRIDAALDSSRAIFGVGRSIGDEPFNISGLVRIACAEVGMRAVRRALSQGTATDAALARLQADLLGDGSDPFELDEMRGERAVLDEVIRRVRDGELPIAALSGGPATPETASSFSGLAEGRPRPGGNPSIAPWGRLWFDHQRAVGLEWMNEAVAIVRRPGWERPPRFQAWDAEMLRVKGRRLELFGALLPILMAPAVAASAGAHDRYRAGMGATALLVAAERHRLRSGNWPDSIGAIDRSILPDPPVDPYAGGPYRLVRRDGRFAVHSVGPNRLDEGGAYDPDRYRQDRSRGDDFGTGAWDVPLRGRPSTPGLAPAPPPGGSG